MVDSLSPSPSLIHVADSAAITARSKSNFSSAFIFLSLEKRLAIKRVYAFFRIIDDVVDEEENAHHQKELMEAWKGELHRMYTGTTIVPLLKELKESVDRFGIPKEYFLKLIEGCEMDMTKNRYQTFDELYQYCYRVASMVGLVCMKIFESDSAENDRFAIDLGLALQLTNIIRDVGVDLAKNRIYLPVEDLKRFNISEDDLKKDGRSEAFLELMEFQFERAQSYYQKSMPFFENDPHKKLLAARIMGDVYRRLLIKIRKKGYPVLTKRVRLSLFEKMGILVATLSKHYL